jgi:hypothetical protein
MTIPVDRVEKEHTLGRCLYDCLIAQRFTRCFKTSWELFLLTSFETPQKMIKSFFVKRFMSTVIEALLFLVYLNDLPKAIEHKALPILFADDTSILITSANIIQMQRDSNIHFELLINGSNQIRVFRILTKPLLFNLLIKVYAPRAYKLNMKINKYSK